MVGTLCHNVTYTRMDCNVPLALGLNTLQEALRVRNAPGRVGRCTWRATLGLTQQCWGWHRTSGSTSRVWAHAERRQSCWALTRLAAPPRWPCLHQATHVAFSCWKVAACSPCFLCWAAFACHCKLQSYVFILPTPTALRMINVTAREQGEHRALRA